MNVLSLIHFCELVNQLQKVKRVILIKDEETCENDVEHQYQLAMVAWYLIESSGLDLDKDLVVQYALVHDFVEVYAGDTYFIGDRSGKEDRERVAAERLRQEFAEFSSLHDLIERYEARDDRESRFVYALDKVLPMINIYLDGGRTWKRHGLTVDVLFDSKVDKVALSPEVQPYFDEVIALLRSNKDLF